MLNVDELLLKWAETTPNALAFVDEDREVTYAELNLDVRKVANVLAQSGVSRGDIVAMALPPFLGWIFAMALQLLGATILPRSSETSFPKEFTPDWHVALTADPNFSSIPLILFDNTLLEKITASAPIGTAPGYADKTDINYMFSTSGTTGLKKYIALSSVALSERVAQEWPLDLHGKEEILTFPAFGGAWGTLQAFRCLVAGKPFINCAVIDKRLLNLIQKYSIRTFAGSPTQISSVIDLMKKTDTQLPEIKAVLLSGSLPTPTLIDRIRQQFNAQIFDVYSSTEGSAIATRDLTNASPKGGKISPNIEVQIIDENENVVPNGTAGQIRYRREVMAKEYHLNPEATAEYFKDGFFYPGDLAYIDEFGHLVISGRISEIINLGGVKISPDAVDAIAMAQPGVRDCAAFALTNEKGVEKLAIAVVADPGFDLESFKSAISAEFHLAPSKIVQIPKIPRNALGKALRQQLSAENSSARG